MRKALLLSSALVCASARGAPLDAVELGDLDGTNGRWQVGEVTVAAPAAEVQRWLADYSAWPSRFPDVEWSEVRGSTPDGRSIVRFRSRVLGRTMTIRVRNRPGLITYDGEGKNVTTQGKIFIATVGEHQSRVIMQTTAELHGLTGAVATAKIKRNRALRKLRADLEAVVQLSRAFASTPQGRRSRTARTNRSRE